MDSGAPLLLLWAAVLSAFASGSAQDHVTVRASSRSNALLPCKAPLGTDLENLALEWTRPDLDEERYVFFFRDGRPFLVYQHRQFEGRVELADPTLRSGDLSIRLHDSSQLDSGRYECHVFSQSRVRKRSSYNTQPIRTIDLTVEEDTVIQAFPGQDVVFPLDKLDFPVSSLLWKRQDNPEHFVFLLGMGHPHHQHPLYSGRTELKTKDPTEDQDLDRALDHTRDLSVILRRVQPSDSGTYHCHIIQSKRDLHQSEPYRVVILKVASSGSLRLEATAGFSAAVLVSLFLQILQ